MIEITVKHRGYVQRVFGVSQVTAKFAAEKLKSHLDYCIDVDKMYNGTPEDYGWTKDETRGD